MHIKLMPINGSVISAQSYGWLNSCRTKVTACTDILQCGADGL